MEKKAMDKNIKVRWGWLKFMYMGTDGVELTA
jgi:hypothetical protein